ncbi:hypothetical protein BDV95DRAFT_182528 [Massariosphaeria phaeospora]|uniref:Uncharacterized protein n=1 Tax=Massariosphaeria phaeospora TaxID=100035 RepID=A0A7C8I069_9PLEO|nr:hypothetical protein BDV95DRAFT_182528 [Massariosphaeria phaeospora]
MAVVEHCLQHQAEPTSINLGLAQCPCQRPHGHALRYGSSISTMEGVELKIAPLPAPNLHSSFCTISPHLAHLPAFISAILLGNIHWHLLPWADSDLVQYRFSRCRCCRRRSTTLFSSARRLSHRYGSAANMDDDSDYISLHLASLSVSGHLTTMFSMTGSMTTTLRHWSTTASKIQG